jgi:hypothetical protein
MHPEHISVLFAKGIRPRSHSELPRALCRPAMLCRVVDSLQLFDTSQLVVVNRISDQFIFGAFNPAQAGYHVFRRKCVLGLGQFGDVSVELIQESSSHRIIEGLASLIRDVLGQKTEHLF